MSLDIKKIKSQIKEINWAFVLKTAGFISALIVLIIGFSYFASERADKLTGINENRLMLRTVLSSLASYAADNDKDNIIEPPPATDINGQYGQKPGYFVPVSLNIVRENKDGKPLLYCAFDYGSSVDTKRYFTYRNSQGQVEQIQIPSPATTVMAIIDPGTNGKYETSCEMITQRGLNYGDDIIEYLNYGDMEKLNSRNAASPRKKSVTCAFGEIYTWDEAKQNWACQMPNSEQIAQMPAGCPNGQVLMEKNKKVSCVKSDAVIAQEEQNVPMPQAGNNNLVPITSNPQSDSNAKPQAFATQSLDDQSVHLPVPANNKNQNQTNLEQASLPLATNSAGVVNPATNTNFADADIQDINNTVQQNAKEKTGRSIAANTNQKSVRTKPLNRVNITPGESISNIEDDYLADEQIAYIKNNASQNQVADNDKIEMTINKRKKKYKLKSCTPWTYLPRNLGVVNQCIRTNYFGDYFGASANMTTWPLAKLFLQGVFMICPVGTIGQTVPCRAINVDKDLFTTQTKNNIFSIDAFVCARMNAPLAPPWPQYESFVYSESLRGTASCRIDQTPVIISAKNSRSIQCMPVSDLVNSYRHNGYCGCGWSLIWDSTQSKFICS